MAVHVWQKSSPAKCGFRELCVAWIFFSTMAGLCSSSAFALADGVPTTFKLGEGSVIDSQQGRAYVMDPAGVVVALDLATGHQVWNSKFAGKPLTISDQTLLVQATAPHDAGLTSHMAIAVLDASKGSLIEQAHIALPDDVHVALPHTRTQDFTAEATIEGSQALIEWQYRQRPRTGVYSGHAPPQTVQSPPAAAAAPLAVPSPPKPAAAAPQAAAESAAAGANVRMATESILHSDSFKLDISDLTKPAEVLGPSKNPKVFGPVSPPVVSTPGSSIPQPQFLSSESRYVVHPVLIADDRQWDKYRWDIYERETGTQIGSVPMHVRVAPFTIASGGLCVEVGPYEHMVGGAGGKLEKEPLQLRMIDIATGKVRWKQPMRDLDQTRGPTPP